jgi:isopentenyl diphosphate isomerase/L-lactate dehydrogenase-like FMN-dependent dehydrogenase
VRYDEITHKGLQILQQAGIEHWMNLGAETQTQNRLNREYIDSLAFEMRFLGDGRWADTRTTLFGVDLPAPIMPAALTASRVINKLGSWEDPYLELFAAGVAQAKSIMWVGMSTTYELQRIMDVGAPVVKIVKPLVDNDDILHRLKHAEERGVVAAGIDIDAMYLEKAFDEKPGPPFLAPKSIDEIKRFRDAVTIPFILKGVLSVHDARIASDQIGADCIVVSNHGGEAIDYSVPILQILPEIREAVPDMTILVDSGFKRGTDVLKALALGADGVCFGNLLLLAFVAFGAQGVADMLQNLTDELRRNMSITGGRSVDTIDPSIIRYP